MRSFFILCLTLIQILAVSGLSYAEIRTALVMGNGAYNSAPLANPVNDAKAMKNVLEKVGFDVICEFNADKGTMLKAIDRFSDKLQRSDVGLFYFAGHGVQINQENFLIPTRAHITSETDVEYAALAAGRVLGKMKSAGTRLNIVILDACRDNPFERSFRSSARGLARMKAPVGSIVAYSTAPGSVASDGTRGNGLYTSKLMKYIQTPGMKIEDVFKYTRIDVVKTSKKMGKQQVPWEHSSLMGDFYFASGATVVDEPSNDTVSSSTGSLRVNSQPGGAKIFLNNRFKGNAPLDITGITPGDYGVQGSLKGYITKEKRVRVNSGRRAMVTLYLDPAVTKSRLFVTPKPAHARVRIMNIADKYYTGIELDPGRYQVEVSASGYITSTQWVEVGTVGGSSGGIDLYVELQPEQNPSPVSYSDNREWKDPVTGMEFVWVPGGKFMMGSNNGDSDEKPVHKVHLDGFWMGKYEVTNAQYRKYKSSHDSKSYDGVSLNGDSQPAVYVSWDDAKRFIKWLNRKSGKTFALPTEAQWEYACRAGSTGQRFWGDSPDQACEYANVHDLTSKQVNKFDWTHHNCDDGFSATSPVGSFKDNAFDLYDMLGNVWEWCEDIYARDAYKKHSSNNPIYTQGGSRRVYRGGSWDYRPANVRCAFRDRYAPGLRFFNLGFRLCRTQ